MALLVKNPPANAGDIRDTGSICGLGRYTGKQNGDADLIVLSNRLNEIYMHKGASQVALVVKNPPANAGDIRDISLIPRSQRSPGGGHGNLLQYSCLENHMDRRA